MCVYLLPDLYDSVPEVAQSSDYDAEIIIIFWFSLPRHDSNVDYFFISSILFFYFIIIIHLIHANILFIISIYC